MAGGGDVGAVAFRRSNLTDCDREPIHIPGSIQPYGAMLVLDPETLIVLQAAGNIRELLGADFDDMLNRSVAERLPPESLRQLESLLTDAELKRPLHMLQFCISANGRPLDASVHRSEGLIVVEFEPTAVGDARAADPLAVLQEMLTGLNTATSVEEFCGEAVRRVRRTVGYDRVMLYRFLPDESGSVLAEDCAEGLPPYLGLRYPASDIPRQARQLYVENWLRVIGAVNYTPAPLRPSINQRTGRPLDMSHATLRSVSPVHLEYLANMGVAASMSISIIRGGALWGLIACHHHEPLWLPRHLRAVCELFGQMFSFQLEAIKRAEALQWRQRASAVHSKLVGRMSRATEFASGLIHEKPNLFDYVDSEGVALLIDGQYSAMGRCPDEAQTRALAHWLDETAPGGFFVTDALSETYAPARAYAADASGLLVIGASRSPSDYIFWFRPELVEMVRWAGNPEKALEQPGSGERLTPRKSFETWSQSVRGRSKHWTESEVEAAQALRLSLLEVVLRRIDQIARTRAEAERKHELMIAELNHRVKNTLASIQALAHHTKRTSASLDSYVRGLERRIQAMANSHNLLTDASWEKLPLKNVVESQVGPYATSGNLRLEGPIVELDPKYVAGVGLMFHELATNAAKYGALSGEGLVVVEWRLIGPSGAESLEIQWRESGGPLVRAPTREGFGSFAIKRLIPLQIGGVVDMRYAEAGLECDINLPPEAWSACQAAEDASAAAHHGPAILVVEDEALIAFQIEEAVQSLGWRVVGPISRVAPAAAIAAVEPLDGAILDVNVAGELIWPVAAILRKRGVPFLFATGYDRSRIVAAEFGDTPVIGKPFNIAALTACIKPMFGKREGG